MNTNEHSADTMAVGFQSDEAYALGLDAADPLAGYRDRFHIPKRPDGSDVIYFAGNSLGLQPKGVKNVIEEELADWAGHGVEGHFEGTRPWYTYHELFRESGARLVGAKPGEVVVMNSLTVNLHLMMVTFYRPTQVRYKILMEAPAFPSDLYALKTQVRHHGYDPNEAIVIAEPRVGAHTLRTSDIEQILEEQGDSIALVWLGGVNFVTGQRFDMQRITDAAKRRGCVIGFDLAHAAGNVPLRLHDWGVDFAVWCNYKYLNSGPGAVGGCFVHETHGHKRALQRFGGWWGNDPGTRFRMHLESEFVPQDGAGGWQVSNPPILAMAPVKVSYDMFDEVGMIALGKKSELLTGYLEYLIDQASLDRFELITPRDKESRGCQLSILVHDRPKALLESLKAEGVVCDFREPDVVRVAPVPLYNSFHDVWRMAQALPRTDRV